MGKKNRSLDQAKSQAVPKTLESASLPSETTKRAPQSTAQPVARAFIRNLSRPNLALVLLTYIFLVHLTGLFVFTKGFLLSRLSIPTVSPAYTTDHLPPIPATHKKAVILIIDALRTDFISPHHPSPASPNHHGILTLPAEISEKYPDRSLIFNAYSDPPTTTMQRLKGITTGSLPTFIDAGSNFASTAIEEDSLISQLNAAEKKVVFMGDDTWLNLFPDSFHHAHPYDSFNVEDLHSVDNGVIEHLFPYLAPENQTEWDVLIGHFLGVDHVGHRVGPERDTMKTKLQQMDDVLRDVVEKLDDDTLLVVLGDHGMDSKGNHGGDSDLETASALWLYSKGSALAQSALDPSLVNSWPQYTFPGSMTPIRHINQIDLVPTLALLLGIPIPFNNLGSVIPECFSDTTTLEIATRTNAEQIMRYIAAYGDSDVESLLHTQWEKAISAGQTLNMKGSNSPGQLLRSVQYHRNYALFALERLRALWAQFSVPLITIGLLVLGLSIPTLLALYIGIRNNGPNWDVYVRLALDTALLPSLGAGATTAVGTIVSTRSISSGLKAGAVAAVLISEVLLTLPIIVQLSRPNISLWSLQRFIGPFVLLIHAISFASNSFIMWEDRMVVFLLNTIPVVHLIKSILAPTATMRWRIIGGSAIILVLTRLIGSITVCREEQQPYCRVTFYSGSTPTASSYALFVCVLIALHLPRAVAMVLDFSKSLAGPARGFLGYTWRGTLLINAAYWILEWLESWEGLQSDRIPLVNFIRLSLARVAFVSLLVVLPWQWFTGSLCIEVKRDPDQTGDSKAVTVFGFANAYGSTYLLFLLMAFATIHLTSQPMAQIALAGMLLVILAHLEVTDTQRDALVMQRSFAQSSSAGAFDGETPSNIIVRPSFTDIAPLALLGHLGFFATGHQAVLTTIQWKAAFVGFTSVTYPFSPLLVILNTWGPFLLSALSIPLIALWNISPQPQGSIPLLAHAVQASIGFIIYHTTTTLASALFATHLRRHLMVWKVFAPRFMLGAVTLLVVDLGVLIAIGVGVRVTAWKVWKTFKCVTV